MHIPVRHDATERRRDTQIGLKIANRLYRRIGFEIYETNVYKFPL